MTLNRLYLRSSAWPVVGVSLTILLVQALGGIVLARVLGPTDRGLLAALVLWGSMATDLVAVGSPYAVSYWAALERPRSGLDVLRRSLPWMAPVALAIYGGIVAISGRSERFSVAAVSVMGVWVLGQLVHLPVQRLQQGLRKMTWFNGLRSISEMGPTLGYVLLAVSGLLTVATAAASITLALLAATFLGLWLIHRIPQPSDGEDPGQPAFWSYARRSWFSVLATRSNDKLDLFVLTLLVATAADIGYYAVAATATGVIAVLIGSLGLDLFPKVASSLRDMADPGARIWRFVRATSALAGLAALAFYLVADWLIPFVYGSDFSPAVPPAQVLVFGAAASAVSRVAGQGLAGLGYPGRYALAQMGGAFVTVVGAVLAARRSLSLVAAAAAAGYFVTMILTLVLTRTVLKES